MGRAIDELAHGERRRSPARGWMQVAAYLRDDTRYAFRGLRRNLGSSIAVVTVLGVGIGMNTAMFGAVRGMVSDALYADAAGVVRVGRVRVGQRGAGEVSRGLFETLREASTSFEALAGFVPRTLAWRGPEGPVLWRGAAVSPAIFPLLRVGVHMGRAFAQEEEVPGGHQVVLLSHRTWNGRFSGDPHILGASILLGGAQYTVVGVLAEDFVFPGWDVEFLIPLVLRARFEALNGIRVTFPVLGRLRAGVTVERARVEFRAIVERANRARAVFEERVIPLREEMIGPYRGALVALSLAAALVLVIGVVNVTGVLLARMLIREGELAMLGVLGASPARVVRLLLLEAVALSLVGSAVGLGLAALVHRLVVASAPFAVTQLVVAPEEPAVIGFAAMLSVCVGMLVGVVPALQWLRGFGPGLGHASASVVRGVQSIRGQRSRSALVVVQVALAVVLVGAAVVLVENFARLIDVDPGYEAGNVLTASIASPDVLNMHFDGITLAQMNFRSSEKRRFYRSAFRRLSVAEDMAAVEAVGFASRIPLVGVSGELAPLGVESDLDLVLPQARITQVDAGYFAAMRPRVRAGRLFTGRDREGSPPVAIVNETLAWRLPGPAVGQNVSIHPHLPNPPTVEIVGVIANVAVPGLAEEAPAEMYLSLWQPSLFREPEEMFVAIRTRGSPTAVVPFLRAAIAEVNARAVPDNIMTMADRLAAAVAVPRFYAVGAVGFAGLALLLAMNGLYGVLSNSVWQRQHELGVRRALGAGLADIGSLVLRQGARLVGGGVVFGVLGSVLTMYVLETLLVGVVAMDMRAGPAVGVAVAVVIGVAVVGCWGPTRRAMRIEPVEAIRGQ